VHGTRLETKLNTLGERRGFEISETDRPACKRIPTPDAGTSARRKSRQDVPFPPHNRSRENDARLSAFRILDEAEVRDSAILKIEAISASAGGRSARKAGLNVLIWRLL